MMRDHGGDIARARAKYGGAAEDWIDLSTGINRISYPLPDLPPGLWQSLPDRDLFEAAIAAAKTAYRTDAQVLPVAGAQAAIQLLPHVLPQGSIHIVGPTYNEHAACFAGAGWSVIELTDIAAIPDQAIALIVNPNNPDGRAWSHEAILELASRCRSLIVDESFADAVSEVSVAAEAGEDGLIVLRSFGKFYGLAGMRLGFALGDVEVKRMAHLAGPWAVSGPALAIGAAALSDTGWADQTRARLRLAATRLDEIAQTAGWRLVGGTPLFRLFETDDAKAAQNQLARHRIWSRVFPYSKTWLRLGFPGPTEEWDRLAAVFSAPD